MADDDERRQHEDQGEKVVPRLIDSPVPPDLLQTCEDLLDGVRTGAITGLGIVVLLRNRRFFVDALGTIAKNPYPARGYVAALDDCLREIGHRKKDTETTGL